MNNPRCGPRTCFRAMSVAFQIDLQRIHVIHVLAHHVRRRRTLKMLRVVGGREDKPGVDEFRVGVVLFGGFHGETVFLDVAEFRPSDQLQQADVLGGGYKA